MWMVSPPVGVFQSTKKLVLSERAGRERALEFLRKNAANGLSVANLLAGLSSILCSVNSDSCSPPGIPFTYRGLPCPYPSALLASTFLLSGGHVALLRVAAATMILGMADCGSYPHDRVLESQLWKKLVYAGGVLVVLLAPVAVAAVYCLAWATSYIVFPFALWSCKA
ncbi:hypothetical protein WISP_73947 [Willisornis vidua]|uniref:Transmembrane protein 269 n=1 Tax=Willisornis vidua TaxID=1566151 RepID=A0ABQ9D738_9PASS|nr:hypothetical protein WISP_73947 [Willisornis vidua]